MNIQTGDSPTPYLGLLSLSAWNTHREWHSLLTYKPIIFRRPSPSKALVFTRYGQPLAWFALPIDGNTVCPLQGPCSGDCLQGQMWGGKWEFFTDVCLHSFRPRWPGQGRFSIWTHWYIPLALILVTTSCQQDTWSEKVKNTRFYHPITTLLPWTQLCVCVDMCVYPIINTWINVNYIQ